MIKIIVNGTFDIIHRGHLELLNYARSLGDYLLVVIDSDRRVKELKGNLRPINPQEDRITLLENLRAVDMVQTFDSDKELISIIKSYQPDIMVKGSDYRDRPIIGSEYCKEIKFYERIEKYSTTGTIQDIINRG
jgi:D-beta-D-heptose 7-phosphate kinase/D-beta-D-heptose 1-phosphate adenosyltransferase